MSKHNLYIDIAERVAQESYCERAKVGAILVKNKNIISMGYNGCPSGMSNVCEIDGVTKPEVLHAESNAILKCAKNGSSCDNAVLYCSYSPCFECAKLIIQSGIKEVYYSELYRDQSGLDLLQKANILTTQL
tara:strand:- start:18007 stop:18402 length:396 start_codon:yes stop_codon:yes gene_type:complete